MGLPELAPLKEEGEQLLGKQPTLSATGKQSFHPEIFDAVSFRNIKRPGASGSRL
jgi:hypothetical protein